MKGYGAYLKCMLKELVTLLLVPYHQATISLNCHILPLTHCLTSDHEWQITNMPSMKHSNVLTPQPEFYLPKAYLCIALYITLYSNKMFTKISNHIFCITYQLPIKLCRTRHTKFTHQLKNKFER